MPIFQDAKGKNISNFQKMIDEKKNTIRKYYDEIGHLYYGQYKDVNVDMTKDINARCESISNLYIEIEDLNVKILRERGLKKCAVCSTENNLSNAFCFKCGTKFDPESAKRVIMADEITTPAAPVEDEVAEDEEVEVDEEEEEKVDEE